MQEKLTQIIESLMFMSDSPLSITKIKTILPEIAASKIKSSIKELNKTYEKTKSALTIIEVANGYQIVTREEYADYIEKLFKGRSASRLTARALETLAIIAYEQPITKVRMEQVRGVNVDGVVKTLLERDLISIVGREKVPGNPLLYGTTNFFLEYFGLKDLSDLPKLKEIDELLKSDDEFLKSLDQVALQQLEPEALGIKNVGEVLKSNPDEKEQRELILEPNITEDKTNTEDSEEDGNKTE